MNAHNALRKLFKYMSILVVSEYVPVAAECDIAHYVGYKVPKKLGHILSRTPIGCCCLHKFLTEASDVLQNLVLEIMNCFRGQSLFVNLTPERVLLLVEHCH